jgi:hypothetical protein
MMNRFMLALLILAVAIEGKAQFDFTINNGTATITGYKGTNVNVIVPASINGFPVVAIGSSAFAYLPIFSVVLPDTVVAIGAYSFAGCLDLTNFAFGNGIATIGGFAFDNCLSLVTVTLPATVTSLGDESFANCPSLTGAYFYGNAPASVSTTFLYDSLTVYYLPGTTGWGATFAGQPTAPWTLPAPLILTRNSSLGLENNQFGFVISWATNRTVVVEATTNLSGGVWEPLQTNSLVNGTNYFHDPNWTNFPNRFYRIRAQ